jgi:hypothetical protein
MHETGKSRIIVFCLALIVVIGGVGIWQFLSSDTFRHWWFARKLTLLAEEGLARGRNVHFMESDWGEIRVADPVLEEKGRFIRPAAVEFASSRDTVLTVYDLVVWDDLNENNTQDPDEPAWTWLEERAEGIAFDDIYEPPRKPVAEQAEEVRNPYYRLKLADGVSNITKVSGVVNPSMKVE